MSWFKIDDGFWSHPKVLQLSDGALGLWVRAGSWSMFHLTDGFIPDYALPVLRSKPRFVAELQAVLLWTSEEGGNRFHDWSQYQPTREAVQADRDAAAERKRKSREKSREQSRVTGAVTPADAAAPPTRPDPTRPSSTYVEEEETKSEIAEAIVRPDVAAVLDALDDRLRANGLKLPKRNRANVSAARLLIDRDGKTVEQITRAIDWATNDEFWRANILSMSKLREKYDQLALAATRKPGSSVQRSQATALDLQAHYQEEEARAQIGSR